jgi:hypothetical protein
MLVERIVFDASFNVVAFKYAIQDRPEFAAWRGYMLEALMHKLFRAGGKFRVRSLTDSVPVGDATWEERVFLPAKSEEFVDLASIGPVKADVYYQPKSKNYPTIDSFMVLSKGLGAQDEGPRLCTFQCAVSESHKVEGSVLKKVRDHVMDNPDPNLKVAIEILMKPRAAKSKLPVHHVFVTGKEGIRQSQTILTSEGKPYAKGHEPEVIQYALVLGNDFDAIVNTWTNEEEERELRRERGILD